MNVENGTADVSVDTTLAVTVANAQLQSVDVTSSGDPLAGTMHDLSGRGLATVEHGRNLRIADLEDFVRHATYRSSGGRPAATGGGSATPFIRSQSSIQSLKASIAD